MENSFGGITMEEQAKEYQIQNKYENMKQEVDGRVSAINLNGYK